jgi:hypothetical protein
VKSKNWGKAYYGLCFLAIIAVIFLDGCHYSKSTINIGNNNTSSLPTNWKNTPWIEIDNRFDTSDLARAQEQIPFPIILPNYHSDSKQKISLPYIEGPLKQFQEDNNVEIIIRFGIISTPNVAVMISESNNNTSSLGEPELDPELEKIEIEGMSVLKTRDNWSMSDVYYSFNSKNIYYNLEAHFIPNEECREIVQSIVESIIAQIK